ncbi:MAG: HEAT repeat domain-containing protein [Chloroflexi bacterium CFX4]|nr:HEAT repeat domain-containing protein [Chloroflexi bacterium CFX4]MDL1921249.1 hypothetical protein [Chloroflexi bacterium CFX3]
MIEPFLNQLRSLESAQRRAAIIALGKLGDLAALKHLAHVYRTDPDPELRDLALKAGRHIQQMNRAPEADSLEALSPVPPPAYAAPHPADAQTAVAWQPSWQLSRDEAMHGAPPAEEEPPQYVSTARQQVARGNLAQAYTFRTQGNTAAALLELGRALQTDPTLVQNASARRLAADLTDLPPKQAIAQVLDDLASGKLSAEGGTRLKLPPVFGTRLAILTAELPLLLLAILFFVVVYSYRLRVSMTTPDVNYILPSLLNTLNGGVLGRALPKALGGMLMVFFYISAVYMVGTSAGGTGDVLRFANVMIAVQILMFVVLSMALLFIPFATFHDLGNNTYALELHLGGLFIGGAWAFLMQAHFAGLAHRLQLPQGISMVVVGGALAIGAAHFLGVFRGAIL